MRLTSILPRYPAERKPVYRIAQIGADGIGPEVIEGKAKPLFIHGDRGDQTASVSA